MFRIREHLFHFIRGESSPVGVDKICHYDSVTWSPEGRIQLKYTLKIMNRNKPFKLFSRSSYVASTVIYNYQQIIYTQQYDCLQGHWHHLVDNSLCMQVKSILELLSTLANNLWSVYEFTDCIIYLDVCWFKFSDEKRNLPGCCRRLDCNNFNSSLGGSHKCSGCVEMRDNTKTQMKNRTDLSVN